ALLVDLCALALLERLVAQAVDVDAVQEDRGCKKREEHGQSVHETGAYGQEINSPRTTVIAFPLIQARIFPGSFSRRSSTSMRPSVCVNCIFRGNWSGRTSCSSAASSAAALPVTGSSTMPSPGKKQRIVFA